jgi:hypothetical protein
MKRNIRMASLVLAGLLHIAPIATRVVQVAPALAKSPLAIVMTWAIRVAALAGAYHTVSAASAVLASATSVSGTVGTRLSYQIRVSDGENRTPESWQIQGTMFSSSASTTRGMPPGLSLSLATGIISGTPTTPGTFPTTITAYELPSGGGTSLTFTVTFNITGGAQPTIITPHPASAGLHVGEPLHVSVTATGTAPFTYKWQKDTIDIPGGTASTVTIEAVDASAAGSYRAIVTGAGGPATSNAAIITVTPLSIHLQAHTEGSTTLLLTSVPGRHYFLQATSSPGVVPWEAAGEITATTSSTPIGDQSPEAGVRIWRYYPGP